MGMPTGEKLQRAIAILLAALVLLDFSLVTQVVFLPDLWFETFHGSAEGWDEALLFLRRCGANWFAFLLLQIIALTRWRREPVWLAVIAGVRLSDVFTDISYVILSTERTWFAELSLPLMGVGNLLFGLFFLYAYSRRAEWSSEGQAG
jgi:hypothetical protein